LSVADRCDSIQIKISALFATKWQSEQCHTILALLSRSIIVVSTTQGTHATPSDSRFTPHHIPQAD
jgi:hypothetical protein